MSKSNDNEDAFWGEYEPDQDIQEQISDDSVSVKKTANISYDGEQHFVRFPKEIAEGKNLENCKVEFTLIEKPEEENEIGIRLIENA